MTRSSSSLPTHFNPRSPHGERRRKSSCPPSMWTFQSTLPARGATRKNLKALNVPDISIHAPRTGSDFFCRAAGSVISDFNPRSPHGERRAVGCRTAPWGDFNPRSPHGERRDIVEWGGADELISIHAPRTGSDGECLGTEVFYSQFQSTLPARGATARNLHR